MQLVSIGTFSCMSTNYLQSTLLKFIVRKVQTARIRALDSSIWYHGPRSYPSPSDGMMDCVVSSLLLFELCKWPENILFWSDLVLKKEKCSYDFVLVPTQAEHDGSRLLLLRLVGPDIHHSSVHVSSVNHRCFAADDWLSSGHRVSSLGLPQREPVCVKAKAATCYNGHLSVLCALMMEIAIFSVYYCLE